MSKNEREWAPLLDFREQMHEMQLKEVKYDSLYERAFLSSDGRSTSEQAGNTTAWD